MPKNIKIYTYHELQYFTKRIFKVNMMWIVWVDIIRHDGSFIVIKPQNRLKYSEIYLLLKLPIIVIIYTKHIMEWL